MDNLKLALLVSVPVKEIGCKIRETGCNQPSFLWLNRFLVTMTRTLRQSLKGMFLCVIFALAMLTSGLAAPVADDRDRQVLESVLLCLLDDPDFHMTGTSTNEAKVVLQARTPEKTGILSSVQIHGDIDAYVLPGDAQRDLSNRNTPPDAKPDTYDAVSVSYTNLNFAASITVVDLSGESKSLWSYRKFREAYPKARGWVEAYLPGYSKDGTRAIVRAGIGPSPHGATVTALLEKRGNKWLVKWHHIAWYA